MNNDRIAAIRERVTNTPVQIRISHKYGDYLEVSPYTPGLVKYLLQAQHDTMFMLTEIDRLTAELFGFSEQLETVKFELLQKTQLLDASQRREQAAVDALELLMKNSMDAAACAICTKDNCGMSRIPPYCNPKWRGHVAEEGAEK